MSTEKFSLELGINNCSNFEYHRDANFLSSSSLKKILESAELFYKECILRERKDGPENPAYLEGSLLHSMVLEPDKVVEEYAFYTGMRKQGKDFEDFKANVGSKIIVSKTQKLHCDSYFAAYLKNPIAVNLIKGGFSEYSIAQIIQGVPLKMRADYINLDNGFIIDVKTTSYPVDLPNFTQTIVQLKYELSAALYCLIAEEYYKRSFDFYWIAVAKKEADCQVYKMSADTRRRGLDMVNKAITKYLQCKATENWTEQPNSGTIIEVAKNYEILEA